MDSHGYNSILFTAKVGATSTANGLKVLQATATAGTFSDLAGSFTTAHTTFLAVEVVRPGAGRYLKAQLVLSASSSHGGIEAWGLGHRALPTTGRTAIHIHCNVRILFF